jgi:hypothetical protein
MTIDPPTWRNGMTTSRVGAAISDRLRSGKCAVISVSMCLKKRKTHVLNTSP